jgi:hypothetical protein
VYATAGEPVTAVRHYIDSGGTDRLKDLAKRLPEEAFPLAVPDNLADLPPWERAAYFTIAGSAADLLADGQAPAWAAVTLGELVAGVGPGNPLGRCRRVSCRSLWMFRWRCAGGRRWNGCHLDVATTAMCVCA